jgi:putative sterol carrier protein
MLEPQLLNAINAEKTIKNVCDRINSKTASISDYTKTIQFYFTDANVGFRIKIASGQVETVEKAAVKQDADVTVSCKVETLQNILDNKLGATRALITRKVTVDGPVLAIRELRVKVLGPEHNATK